jgi:hypothetical protein
MYELESVHLVGLIKKMFAEKDTVLFRIKLAT